MSENPESGKFLFVESRIRIFCMRNLETWGLESGIQFKEYGIPLTIKVRNPSSTDKESLESRIQNCLRGVLCAHASIWAVEVLQRHFL